MFITLNRLRTLKWNCYAILISLLCLDVQAQINIVSDNFNDGNITSSPTWSNNTGSFLVNSTSPLEGSHSLRSNTGGTVASIHTQYGTNTNLTLANYSWTIQYRANTNSNPDELPFGANITNSTNHWRFWIAATGTGNNRSGFYISHSAGSIKFARKRNNNTWDIATHAISLNTTYTIRINRRSDGFFEFLVDAGTADPTSIRWSGYATDVLNSGSDDIYFILEANETSANRFQWDKVGLSTKSISFSQLTNGIHTGDLEEGMTNKAVMGFSATTDGAVTLEEVRILTSSNNNQGTFTNLKLFKSTDNDYSTTGDNTLVTGVTFTLNGDHIWIEDINSTINSSTENYFFVLDVVNNNGGSPPSDMQFSMSCSNCGAAFTNVVTTNAEKVNNFSFSGPTYQFVRVYTWKNTSVVGDFTDNWQNASAWEPFRNNPSVNDILQFSKGGTVNPLNIPNQTVQKIYIRNNTTVNITTASLSNASATITIGGGASEDLSIEAGSTLNVTSTGNTFSLTMPNGTTATIFGNVNLSGKNHVFSAASENGIQFKSGSIFTGGAGLTGNPFGTNTTSSVNFESSSTLIDQAGVDYFSSSNVLVLSNSSLYRHSSTSTALLNNKTFGNLEINSGATFNITSGIITVNGDITGAGNFSSTNGTLNLIGNFNNTGTLTPGTGTINYSGVNQNIKAGNYYNINFNNSGTKTLLGNITFANGGSASLLLADAVQLACSTFTITASSASSSVTINGHLITQNVNGFSGSTSTTIRNNNSPSITLGSNSIIEYNSTSTQAISARADYKNLRATGSGVKNVGAISISNNLHIDTLVEFNMGTNLLSTLGTTTGTGKFLTSNTSTSPVPADKTWSFTYEAVGASQSIVGGTYNNLMIKGTGTKTARADVIVSNELNIISGVTFTLGAFTLLDVGNPTGAGILRTDNLGQTPLPTGINWPYTVQYGAGNQTVVHGTYASLSILGTGTKTVNGNIVVNNLLNINSGVILEMLTNTLTGINSTSGTGRIRTANSSTTPLPVKKSWTFIVEYNATSTIQYVVPGDYVSLTISGARAANNIQLANNDTIYLSGTFTASATFSGGSYILTGNTFVFDGAAQNIPAFTFNNLEIRGTGDKTASANFTVNNNLHIESGRVLIMSTRTLSGINSTSGAGTLRTANTSTTPIPTNKTWNFTVEYNTTSAQTVVPANYSSLTLTGARTTNNITLSSAGNINISDVFNPSATFTSGNYIVTNNTIVFNGATQNIPAFRFNNLTVDGTNDKTITGNVEVIGALNLQNNNLNLSANNLTLSGSVTYSNGNIKAGTCEAPVGNIIIQGSGNFGQLKLHNDFNYLDNLTLNRTGNLELNSDFYIASTLTLSQGTLITDKVLGFYNGNTPISKTNGNITLQTNATLKFGACNFNGNAFVLPNDLFINTPNINTLEIGRQNGITLNNQMFNITGTLRIKSGFVTTNGNITLLSNAVSTARIDSVMCDNCGITGNITVQRFVPGGAGKRRWRLMASPINVAGSLSIAQLFDDTHITGTGGASKGFDESPNNAYSIKTYKESLTGSSNSGWVYPSTIDSSYNTGVGICLFIRGDRNTPDPYLNWSIPNDATFDYVGSANIGNYNLPVTFTNTNSSADGWNLVANPYASTINWNSEVGWQKTNINSKLWLFNPSVGSYGIYDPILDEGTNGSSPYIASGQAFFVKATADNPVLSINERAKVTNEAANFFKAKQKYNILRIVVEKDSVTSDEAMLYLSENASGNFVDQSDAGKFFNDFLNFYFKSDDGFNLNINQHPIPQGPDTIKLSLFSYSGEDVWAGDYKFKFNGIDNLYANIDIYLEDLYANRIINIRDENIYNFSLDNNFSSMGNDRFRLILGKNNNPVGIEDELNAITSFKVYPNPFENEIKINLLNQKESELIEFEIHNQLAQIVKSGKTTLDKNELIKIDTQDLLSGIYVIKLKSKGVINQFKLIKN